MMLSSLYTMSGRITPLKPSTGRRIRREALLRLACALSLLLQGAGAWAQTEAPDFALLQQEQRYSGTFGDKPVPNRV